VVYKHRAETRGETLDRKISLWLVLSSLVLSLPPPMLPLAAGVASPPKPPPAPPVPPRPLPPAPASLLSSFLINLIFFPKELEEPQWDGRGRAGRGGAGRRRCWGWRWVEEGLEAELV
jgi:hypothetical protein